MLGTQASPASAITILMPGWRSSTPEKMSPVIGSNAGRLLREAGRGGDHKIRGAAIFLVESGFFHQDGEVKARSVCRLPPPTTRAGCAQLVTNVKIWSFT